MRTVRSSGRLSGGGGVCSGGVLPGGVSAPRRVWYPSMHRGIPPPQCEQTHACKNITFETSLRMVKSLATMNTTYDEQFLLHLFTRCKRDPMFVQWNLLLRLLLYWSEMIGERKMKEYLTHK